MHSHVRLTVALSLTALAVACGGSSSNSTPSPSQPPAAVITITASGVSPQTVTVARGSQVQFVNNDTRAHEMTSDPHPEHTDCPEINAAGFLSPGQSRQTDNLNTARSCGFHDHNLPTVASLRGTIVIR